MYVDGSTTTSAGNSNSGAMYRVVRMAGGMVVNIELFDVDDLDHAQARFEALASETRTPFVDNAMLRGLGTRISRARHRPGLRHPIDRYHPDCQLIDRRQSVNAGEIAGRDGVDASISSGVDVFGALITQPHAVRGDRLVLITWRFEHEGGFHTGGLSVIEGDDLDRMMVIISFDEDDLTSTMAELEARYRTLAGDRYGPADAFIAACEAGTADLAPDVAARLSSLCAKSYSAGNVLLAVWPDDHSYTVVVLDDDGHATSCEFFSRRPVDRSPRAIRRARSFLSLAV